MAPHRRVRGLRWPSRRQPEEEGFTLVELMVAMVVITT
ncbi:MAG: prepilin-type N-terminal cleavage/methylation domain-containing protein, partial [Acidimicrobiales bacterium]